MYKEWDPAKRPVYDPNFRKRRSPSPHTQESSKGEHSRVTNRFSDDYCKSFRSSPRKRQRTKNLPQETKNRQADSKTYGMEDLIPVILTLPNEIFFEILDKKLDKFKIKKLSQLATLAEFIAKAKDVAANNLLQGEAHDKLKIMFKKAGTYVTPPGSYVASHQNVPSHLANSDTNAYITSSNKSFSSNRASSSKTSVIPGLTLIE